MTPPTTRRVVAKKAAAASKPEPRPGSNGRRRPATGYPLSNHGSIGPVKPQQHGQIVAKLACEEEVLADERLAGLAHALTAVGISE